MSTKNLDEQMKLYRTVKRIDMELEMLSKAGDQLLGTDNIIKLYMGLEDLNQEDPGEEIRETMFGPTSRKREPVVLFAGLVLDTDTALNLLATAAKGLQVKRENFMKQIDELNVKSV